MDATQLLDALKAQGLSGNENGHMLVMLDTWCSAPITVVMHPIEPDEQGNEYTNRSITFLVAANRIDAEQGRPFAAFAPTVMADQWTDWDTLIGRGLYLAQMGATAYIAQAYDQAGFDQEKFLQETAADWSDDQRHAHLDRRLDYAILRKHLVDRTSLLMELPEGEAREQAKVILDMSWTAYQAGLSALSKKDGQ